MVVIAKTPAQCPSLVRTHQADNLTLKNATASQPPAHPEGTRTGFSGTRYTTTIPSPHYPDTFDDFLAFLTPPP